MSLNYRKKRAANLSKSKKRIWWCDHEAGTKKTVLRWMHPWSPLPVKSMTWSIRVLLFVDGRVTFDTLTGICWIENFGMGSSFIIWYCYTGGQDKMSVFKNGQNGDFFVERNWVDQIGSNFTRLIPWPAASIGKIWRKKK